MGFPTNDGLSRISTAAAERNSELDKRQVTLDTVEGIHIDVYHRLTEIALRFELRHQRIHCRDKCRIFLYARSETLTHMRDAALHFGFFSLLVLKEATVLAHLQSSSESRGLERRLELRVATFRREALRGKHALA